MQSSPINTFVRPQASVSSWTHGAALAAAFCMLTAAAAQVRVPVPWTDVPMTLQAFAVLMAGLLCSPAVAVSSMILYVGAGLVGAPVFASGSPGIAGPTGGYIVGFVAAAWLVSLLRGRRDAGYFRLFLAAAAGMACVLACGVAWRTVFFGGDVVTAAATGFVPFAPKALIEALLAAAIARKVHGFRSTVG